MAKMRADTYSNAMEDKATLLLDQGKLRPAQRVLERMLAADKSSLAAHFHLARLYRRTGKYDLALRHARCTLKLNPKERNALLNLGLIYDAMGRDRLAVAYYKKELAQNPDSPETLWNLGRLYFKRHRWMQASRHLRHCFRLRFMPEIEDTVDKLGVCYNKLRDVRSYIEVFTEYVRLFPAAAWAFANLGRALLYAKDYKGAVLRLSRARQLGHKSVVFELKRAKQMLEATRNI